ncbi:heavy metal translocating P-type ATPase [Sphingorhabdus sp. SMR4y]|uniref:heavy metal translocating P-type ATPase n=1 Tax=Sphingorhabdus sp. SMR4y TaxID=2584094 RepID=UPI000B5CF264|nr:heavy metal translocating P-type ATPase [Sphingorhabdus sp. SMR4y]ASK89664.1 putative cadmium-transporting ATPase [Sphingorhabdus sp. SMR4y]
MTDEHRKHSENSDHSHGGSIDSLLGGRAEMVFAGLCGAALLAGWLGPQINLLSASIGFWFLVAAYFFGGYFTILEAFEKIRRRKFEIDFLMIVAAGGAAWLGAWAEGAFLLFLFSIGHALENYAMARARNAISALSDLAPEEAVVRRDGEELRLPVAELVIGDIVIIRSNERLPADGFVVKGVSSVNQAPITGESVPVDKLPVDNAAAAAKAAEKVKSEHRVFAGSINGSGSLEVQVTRLASETTLARVVEMVNDAETRQSPTQSFTNKFERIFVPVVILLAIATGFSWLVIDEPVSDSIYRAMAVLVAASPCALAIATPSAVLSGIARAARGGVLIKGGAPLEMLGKLDSIAFDKTGTLTIGEPELVETAPFGEIGADELIAISAAVEVHSDHPLAQAIVRAAEKRLGTWDLIASDFQSITGKGVSAKINGQNVLIGKAGLFLNDDQDSLPENVTQKVNEMSSRGRSTMIVRRGGEFLGVLGLMDTPRASASEVINKLRSIGITRMMMISGDNQKVADAIALEVGLDKAFGDLMPDDKVEKIAELSDQGGVAMVGDGVNDAPAMANASVGIAMGAAGSDVALETADIALMADDLATLPFAVGLSRSTSGIIRQNLWISLGVVAILIPATLFGLGIGPAVVMHEGSTLVVVINALRLLGYKEN